MGRPKKTTADHERDGTLREDRHAGRRRVPKFDEQPIRPQGLSKEAGEHWDFMVPLLTAKGIATIADSPALVAMCETWGLYRKALRSKSIPGQGRARQMEINGYLREWRAFAAKFGMTPVDRERIETTPGSDNENPFEQFMKARMSKN